MNRISVIIGRNMTEHAVSAIYQEHDEEVGKPIHGQLFDVPMERLVEWRGIIESGQSLQTSVKGHSYRFTNLDHRTGEFTIEPDIPATNIGQ